MYRRFINPWIKCFPGMDRFSKLLRFDSNFASSLSTIRTESTAKLSVFPTDNNPNCSERQNESNYFIQSVVLSLALLSLTLLNNSECEDPPWAPGDRPDLPIYTRKEVAQHKSKEDGMWVTYKNGIYDITEFVANHPGGAEKIILAVGGSVEPFWNLYRQHYNSKLPLEILEEMRIGTLHPDDMAKELKNIDTSDPYNADPSVSPILEMIQSKPINAGAPGTLLTDVWLTPNDMWFVRNHHPVPQVNVDAYRLVIDIDGHERRVFTLDQLKTLFKKKEVPVTIQCGGNRRAEMNSIHVTAGSPWGMSAISTAMFGGALLSEVLAYCGIDEVLEERAKGLPISGYDITYEDVGLSHVRFVGDDGMTASIPVEKAVHRRGDVLLAYEMNKKPLPPEHGFPLRAVVPGHVGVRNVKWVSRVQVTDSEAEGPWQRGMAYKGFGPSTKSIEGIDTSKIHSLQEQPVQSAITIPRLNSTLSPGVSTFHGYAYSGGGRGIVRVDVSIDGGKTWQTASLTTGATQPMNRSWAWTFWECDVDIPEDKLNQQIEVICKATDASYNVQPDSLGGIWNLRGINNNAWHRVTVTVADDE